MKTLFTTVLAAFALTTATALSAADTTPKPFPASLKTCVVSDEKLGGDMGKPYVFVHDGQEVKLCCKSCLKDFNKEPQKYMKKISAAAAGK
jgi:hypothetical protein